MRNLIFNSVICLECGEQLITHHQHDFKKCSCDNEVFIDGGINSYTRYGAKDLKKLQPFQIWDNDKFEVIRFYLTRCGRNDLTRGVDNYVKLKDINDEWLNNIILYEEENRPDNRFLRFYKKEQKYRKKNGESKTKV